MITFHTAAGNYFWFIRLPEKWTLMSVTSAISSLMSKSANLPWWIFSDLIETGSEKSFYNFSPPDHDPVCQFIINLLVASKAPCSHTRFERSLKRFN